MTDWLLGAGVGYLASIPLLWLLGSDLASGWPLAIGWGLSVLVAGPHYGATLLRVYGDPAERRRYAGSAVWCTLLLLGLFVAGVYQGWAASLLVTLYFSWSPWHFAAQNYGIALMFLRRGGARIEPGTRRLLQGSFVCSYAITFVALHVAGSTSLQAPTRNPNDTTVALWRLGLPPGLAEVALWICLALSLLCLAGAARALWHWVRLRVLLCVCSLVATQILWFSLPSALLLLGRPGPETLAWSALWISAAHSAQYLWVTCAYERRRGREGGLARYLTRATLAGNAAFVLPAVLFAPRWLGASLTFDAGLATLVFALVNLQHFVLDGAIWKLRDARVASLLVGGSRESAPEPQRSRRRRGLALAVWGVFALCVLLETGELWRRQAQREGDLVLASRLLDGLDWLGRDHELARIRLGRGFLARGELERAAIQFEASARARPTRAAWGGVGRARERAGDLEGALQAYRAGLELDPADPALRRSASSVLRRIERRRGVPEPASPPP